MIKYAIIILSIFFISCSHLFPRPHKDLLSYNQWGEAIDKALKYELKDLCKSWPETEGKCIDDINFYMPYFKVINLSYNISLLDSILNINNISRNMDYSIFIEESYIDGFNAWHCTRILVHNNRNNRDYGCQSCKTSIERDPLKIEKEIPEIGNIDVDMSYMLKSFNERSAMFSRNAIVAVTELDKNYNIIKCRTVLLP